MRAAVIKDLERISELVRRAQSAALAEDWDLLAFTLRNASHSCVLLSSVVTRAANPDVVDVRDPASAELRNRRT